MRYELYWIHLPPYFHQRVEEHTPLRSSSQTKPDLLRFRCSSGNVLSKPPIFFYIMTSPTHHLPMVKFSEKKSMLENFRANVLKSSQPVFSHGVSCVIMHCEALICRKVSLLLEAGRKCSKEKTYSVPNYMKSSFQRNIVNCRFKLDCF